MKACIPAFAAVAAVFAGCAVGPDYQRPKPLPSQPMPAAFSEAASATNLPDLKVAQPAAHLPRGEWWKVFESAELDRLESLAAAHNQQLAAAAAQMEQARALVGTARADLFPQLSALPAYSRQRTSANAPTKGGPTGQSYTYNNFIATLDLNWELDLWGRVRRSTEGARARFAAAADDVEAAKLSFQAEVATDYFIERTLAAEHALVVDTIATYRHSLELTQNRRKGGVVSDLDVSQAETQLRVTEAELPALELQQQQVLHALAALCGQPATGFQVAAENSVPDLIPELPVEVPSELLERRPDIAAAERRMMAANADIGVAQSAFYPRVFLTGLAGFQSVSASTLFDWPSRALAFGPSVSFPLFTGGRLRSQRAATLAAFDQTLANYRSTVLAAFQEVEDALAAQRLLEAQFSAQSAALAAARRTLAVANNRYRAGLITYLEVAVAQSAALSNERSIVHLANQRLVTQVALIKALGGGWRGDALADAARSPAGVAFAPSR